MAYRPSEGRNQKKQTPPEMPNLVPLMNLFITIVPFLLTIVVISQVALDVLNFSAPVAVSAAESSGSIAMDLLRKSSSLSWHLKVTSYSPDLKSGAGVETVLSGTLMPMEPITF